MRWIVFAIGFIILTIGLAAWVGRPVPLTLIVPKIADEEGAEQELNFERIQKYIADLSRPQSRVTGYQGCDQALAYIQSELQKTGPNDFETQEFEVASPIVKGATLTAITASGPVTIPIHPLWPNLSKTCQTLPEGIKGQLVDVGKGTDEDLKGKNLEGRIALMDWDSKSECLNVPEFGGKAVLFLANDRGDGYTSRDKFMTIPADFPRFYVEKPYHAVLKGLLADPKVEAIVQCDMNWERVKAKNLLVRLSGQKDNSKVTDRDKSSMIFHAYYDSISVVPDLSPGAEQACGVSTLLELAHYFARKEFNRPVYLLFTGGHGQALSGMTHFVRTLKDGLEENWPGKDRNSLIVRMGKPALFVNLDLSSRSARMGVFCVGRFRTEWEHRLRPKFSTLGLKLDEYAKSFRTVEDVSGTLSPFVDCINLTLGRSWWTYFPYQAPFESELPTLATFPGITLATINDDHRYVDTPDDTIDRMQWKTFSRQILAQEGRGVGLAKVALALASWSGPFANGELDDVWGKLSGRVVWLDQQKNYTPNEPLADAIVFMKAQRGDKYLMGTRGIPCVLADDKGKFSFDGLGTALGTNQFAKVTVEAYGTATQDFIDKNPNAYAELLKVRSKSGNNVTKIDLDGSIIYGIDMARAKEYPWSCGILKEQQDLNLVCFPCRSFTLQGLTDPRGYIVLKDLTILEAGTQSPPFEFGQSTTDYTYGNPEENCVTLWADPAIRVRLLLGLGFQGKRLVLINNSVENPIGLGFVLDDLKTIPSMVLQGAEDMWNLDAFRLHKLEINGVENPRIRQIHAQAKENLDLARQALTVFDHRAYRSASERGWSLESKAYGELLATVNNMIRGVLFYLALLLPFSYCMERLLFAAPTVKQRLILMAAIFIVSFIALAIVHPAFRFTMTPLIVLLAFVILALAGSVSYLVVGKMDGLLQERKHENIGVHEDTQNVGNIAIRSIDLGVANIRRRPQRGFLTGATIVLVTFILLSFTSLVPVVNVAKVTHPEGEPTYKGMLVRSREWGPLPNPLRDSLRRSFGEIAENEVETTRVDSVVATRAWFFSDYLGNLSQIDLSPVRTRDANADVDTGKDFTAVALLCMEPSEAQVSEVDKTLIAGRWFQNEDEIGAILPKHIADILGYLSSDLGKKIQVFGQEVPLIGIFDEKEFDKIRDIDGEPLTPVNFFLQSQIQAKKSSAEEKASMLEKYVHYPSDQIVILPLKFGHRLGATFRSVAIRSGPKMDTEQEARSFTQRSNQSVLACDGKKVVLFASLDSSKLTGAGHIVVPLLLGFLIVLSTMLGSVFERRKEIFIYNSVGLTPTNVSSLFLAESTVYAIIGACSGYLLGQIVAKVLLATGTLVGLSLNYSAGSAIFVTLSTMFIVLLSTIYPAREAFLAAIPESDEVTREDDTLTNTMNLYLPFVATPTAAYGMQTYLYEYLDSIQGVTVGKLGIDNLTRTVETKDDLVLPVLEFRAWLSPFDLGVSHDASLGIEYRSDRNLYQFYLRARLFSGDQQNWHRLLPTFIQILRKQLLIWRILSDPAKQVYIDRGQLMFGQQISTNGQIEGGYSNP